MTCPVSHYHPYRDYKRNITKHCFLSDFCLEDYFQTQILHQSTSCHPYTRFWTILLCWKLLSNNFDWVFVPETLPVSNAQAVHRKSHCQMSFSFLTWPRALESPAMVTTGYNWLSRLTTPVFNHIKLSTWSILTEGNCLNPAAVERTELAAIGTLLQTASLAEVYSCGLFPSPQGV